MAATSRWITCPMAGKKLGRRSSWIAAWKRSRRTQAPLAFSGYHRPTIPQGYRGTIG